MKVTRPLILVIVSLLLITIARGQGEYKHFAKDGLSFDYSNSWTINDESNSDAQQLTLARADSDAQIRIFAHRGRVDTPEKMAEARRAFIDPYITSTTKMFVQLGAKPESTPASTQIGGATADGVRLRAALAGEPGEATIYWLTIGNRVVVLTFFGPDKDLGKATSTWDAIRNSLQIAETTPKQTSKPQ